MLTGLSSADSMEPVIFLVVTVAVVAVPVVLVLYSGSHADMLCWL